MLPETIKCDPEIDIPMIGLNEDGSEVGYRHEIDRDKIAFEREQLEVSIKGNCEDYARSVIPELPERVLHDPTFLINTLCDDYDENYDGQQLVVYWEDLDVTREKIEFILRKKITAQGFVPIHVGVAQSRDLVRSKLGLSGDVFEHDVNDTDYPTVAFVTYHKVPKKQEVDIQDLRALLDR